MGAELVVGSNGVLVGAGKAVDVRIGDVKEVSGVADVKVFESIIASVLAVSFGRFTTADTPFAQVDEPRKLRICDIAVD